MFFFIIAFYFISMRCILRKETDPYFNIAAEEYVFKQFADDTFMLWRNDPSVIVGKHQNTFAEINHQFVEEKGIRVVRRISGGGTVYHDHGNLNFTFTSRAEHNQLVDFNKYNRVIVTVLGKLGIDVLTGPRNSLYIDGKKISGNAEHVYKDKVLHHGTLLFNSNIENLQNAIKPAKLSYEDKAVKSISSQVVNITDSLQVSLTIEEFAEFIIAEMLKLDSEAHIYTFTAEDIRQINLLKEEKYTTWEWNYGYSPTFSFSTIFHTGNQPFKVSISVRNGTIDDIGSSNQESIAEEYHQLINILKSTRLKETDIITKLKHHYSEEQIQSVIQSLFVGDNAEHLHNNYV